MSTMHLDHIPINWFDIVAIIILMVGLNQGRKNGMSQELMVCLQWLAIVAAGSFFYHPAGDFLASYAPISHLSCYIIAYVTIAILVKISFSLLKKALGGKLVSGDFFGRSEYYLGMVTGAVRFGCILMAALALLNARYYTPQEIASARAYQNDVYGSNFFPELSSVQLEVFKDSMIGNLIKSKAGNLLIVSTKTENVMVKRRKDDLP